VIAAEMLAAKTAPDEWINSVTASANGRLLRPYVRRSTELSSRCLYPPAIGDVLRSEVVKGLKKRDADVRVLVRKPDVKSQPGVETVVGDLLNPVSIEKAL
jgi:hypothetical protein